MDPRVQPQSHPPSAAVLDPDAANSTETQQIHEVARIHTHTTRAFCYEETSARSITASVKRHSVFVLLLLLLLSAQFTALSLYFCLSLMPPIFPLHCSLSLSLILSCVSVLCSACAQRMLNMCSGWGLGTADFIGGTLTSHTDRLAEDGTVCAHILCTAAVDLDKICLASSACKRSCF